MCNLLAQLAGLAKWLPQIGLGFPVARSACAAIAQVISFSRIPSAFTSETLIEPARRHLRSTTILSNTSKFTHLSIPATSVLPVVRRRRRRRLGGRDLLRRATRVIVLKLTLLERVLVLALERVNFFLELTDGALKHCLLGFLAPNLVGERLAPPLVRLDGLPRSGPAALCIFASVPSSGSGSVSYL